MKGSIWRVSDVLVQMIGEELPGQSHGALGEEQTTSGAGLVF